MLQITFDYWSLCFLNVLNNFLFISGCAGSPLLCELLSGCRNSLQGAGCSGRGSQALEHRLSHPVACGVFPDRAGTLWPVGSSRIRAGTL